MSRSTMTDELTEIRQEIIGLLPALRAFAFGLTRQRADADDLVQDTLVRAIQSLHQYTPGTRLKSWLFTIMRNSHRTTYNVSRRENNVGYEELVSTLRSEPAQHGAAAMTDFRACLAMLPEEQQEVLILIGGLGFSYEETADVLDCAVGTVKSRLSRGRERLTLLLDQPASAVEGSGQHALQHAAATHDLSR